MNDAQGHKLLAALLTLMDQVDYRNGACAPTEMVAAVLPTIVLEICDEAIKGAKK